MDNITVVNAVLLFGAALVLVGILSSLVASRFGAPLLLVFLIIGMLTGADGPGGVAFDNYRLTYLIGSLALAIILFDGGLRTRISHLAGSLAPAIGLATVGVVITAGLIGAFASYVLNLRLSEGFLIGATIASTDAAAVFFLIRASGLQLQRRVGGVLEIESSTNDPVAVFLTVMMVGIVSASGGHDGLTILGEFLQEAIIGGAAGVAGGFALAFVLNKVDLPSGLHPLFVVASAVALFALAAVMHGSGFLAVYLAGIVVGNRQVRALPSIIAFHDTVTWLCQIVMFIVLGLLVTPSSLLPSLGASLAIAFMLIFVARPAAVALCLLPFGFSRKEIGFVGWVGLRGAVSIFLAAIPTLAGAPNAQIYFNVAFVTVIVSLLVQGWTITELAKRLGLAVRQTGRQVQRIEIDLPGQLAQEMVGYPVTPKCPILARDAVPKWATPVFVIREDRILDPLQAGALKPGDYGYFLAPHNRVAELDGLFASTEAGRAKPALSEFALRGDAALATLSAMYGLAVPAEDAGSTVAEVFARRFENEPAVGDAVEFGGATLVVRGVDEGKVVRVGLRIEDEPDATVPIAPAGARAASRNAADKLWRKVRGTLKRAA
ncbi:cell volume regulation protein A [Methylopila capsulata]|uniref:Cell volume regulation protein A n=1 Tax=Methylopila capsulata TaxID=61654 RepID=A0A9W6MR42_9HYPH|nr:potassium/proton antiporter [Methylopila capsulata]MBM7850008.1 cell volume regulation protein A [Methylopila capsulata]GLK55300.1 K+/H+ antiporter [Methylopila capsulata]